MEAEKMAEEQKKLAAQGDKSAIQYLRTQSELKGAARKIKVCTRFTCFI